MTIPDYQTLMLPLLRHTEDQQEHRLREVVDALADQFALTAEERQELLPSGKQATFNNRVGWASTYLKKAGLLDSPGRGVVKITALGQAALAENPERIDSNSLLRYPAFAEFRSRRSASDSETADPPTSGNDTSVDTPEEALERAHLSLRCELADELLRQVMSCSPQFFEQLVVSLLVAMGYGGSRADAGHAIGRSGDEGIDGVINEDRLGLDVIYIQAKRWEGQVGRPEIQKFVGALQGKQAKKGVFITTSSYSQP